MSKFIKKNQIMIIGAIVGAIVGIYIILCASVGSKDFLSNTTINGISMAGLTKEQAIVELEKHYESDIKNIALKLKVENKEYDISLKDNILCDIENQVNEISDSLTSSFFTKGYHYLKGSTYYTKLDVKDDDVLTKNIKDSHILEYDTKVATSYVIQDNQVVYTKGISGKKVDQDALKEIIQKALNTYQFTDVINCPIIDSKVDENEMKEIDKNFNREGQNATLDKDNNYSIIPSKVGVDYNLDEAIQLFNKTKEGQEFTVTGSVVQPTVTTEDLQKHLFTDLLGSYTTYVSGSGVRKNNVKLAGLKCATILLPGEVFSYNGIVGERTAAAGFGEAGAYVNGETVQVVGGGVCQPSSTLYNAAVLANLEIVERRNHTYVSSYVPVGRDATVSWGTQDFKFKNNMDYPIKIVPSYSNSRLTMKIYGYNKDNIKVVFSSEQLSSTPYETIEKNDPTLEEGKKKVEVTGYVGAKARSYRAVYKDGKLISKKLEANSIYKKRNKIVLVGTKKKPVVEEIPVEQ